MNFGFTSCQRTGCRDKLSLMYRLEGIAALQFYLTEVDANDDVFYQNVNKIKFKFYSSISVWLLYLFH